MSMDVSSETNLNNNQSAFNYKSFGGTPQSVDGTPTKDLTYLQRNHDEDTDLSHFPNKIPLKQLASGSPNLYDKRHAFIKETDKDPLPGGPGAHSPLQDTLIPIYVASITFAMGVTIALILQIYLGKTQVFIKGVLVSDHEHCTALGQKVLRDEGSSVDAAIVATLCLGVMHPHMSGIGGGGVMLVHDMHKNETRVINFQETAPYAIKEEMLQNIELKRGLQVGVPGLLKGLHQAHHLYGRMSWEDVVTRAADVAREGFNVSHSLAEAISKVKGENLSRRFRNMFFPGSQALLPGSFLRMPSLAGVLQAGLSDFYNGNLSQEMEDEVKANGGVLSSEDISNYSVEVGQPVEGLYHEFIVQVPPPPSIGAALISALNLLECFHLNEGNSTANNTYHWIAECLKAALAMAGGLGDPMHDSSITALLSEMLSKRQADVLRQTTNYSHASPPEHYSSVHFAHGEPVAGQVVVIGSDDVIVSVASSLSRPFGSRIVTPSGILLNSHILDFSWPNKTQRPLLTNQRNRIQPGKRPLSSLMPTIVVPTLHKCGTYMALSNSDEDHSLRRITQVLRNALSYKEINDSLSLQRLNPQLHTNSVLVDSEFPEQGVQVLRENGHVVQGIQRNKDIIKAIAEPHSSGSFL